MSIINVDIAKCVGCNACIKACPAKDANIASFDEKRALVITIDDSKCIKCGSCIHACSHNARYYADDTAAFIHDLEQGESIHVIVAPAIQNAFDGCYEQVLMWLRDKGAKGIYDVSFGADICTWAHIRALEKNPDAKLISQPCAAIVNYAMKQRPELIEYLSPIQSPMLCTAIYLKKYKKISGKIAALSPCIAKKDEFDATGVVSYNVTLKHLRDYFDSQHINVRSIKSTSNKVFDRETGVDGVIYSKPGGLKADLLAHNPNLNVINTEGVNKVYGEFEEYLVTPKKILPQVLDVLNCEFGCNGGPAIGEKFKPFQISNELFKKETESRKKRHKQRKLGKDTQFLYFDKNLKTADFIRVYNTSVKRNAFPSKQEIENAYITLRKTTQTQRNFNCNSCGFQTCHDMAVAIARGINLPENCRQYTMDTVKDEREEVASVNRQVLSMNQELMAVFKDLSVNIENVIKEAIHIGAESEKGTRDMEIVNTHMGELRDLNQSIIGVMEIINHSTADYQKMTNSVQSIADTINLLSLNASVEAAHAGQAGKGFAVIADHIRSLSDTSKTSVVDAQLNDERVERAIAQVNKIVEVFKKRTDALIEVVNETIGNVQSTSEKSQLIIASVEGVNTMAERVYGMIEQTNQILNK